MAALGIALAACAAKQASSEAQQTPTPAPVPAVPVPENCDEPAAAATAARAATGEDAAGEKTSAIFALAECEQLRFGADKAHPQAKLDEIVALYAEAMESKVPKYVIGGHIRTGDAYNTASNKQKAREAYESGLSAADGTDSNTRLDLDISDWVKDACKNIHQLGGQERQFKVCQPWKQSWR